MARKGHVPIRTCVVCNAKRSQSALLRLAVDAERLVAIDYNRCIEGRGGYVCPGCISRLRFTNRVQKVFRNQARGLAKNILQLPSILHNDGTSGDSEERRPKCDEQSLVQQGGSFHGAHEGA